MTEGQRPFNKVIVVGAGPSGLLLSLLLSQRGIPVHVVEAEAELDSQPRAAHYGAPALPDLDRAGVLAEVKRRGIVVRDLAFRHPGDAADGRGFAAVARLDTGCVADVDGFDYRTRCLVLQDLDALMLDMLGGRRAVEVSFGHRVVDVGQDGGVAWVDVVLRESAADGRRTRIEGDYVVGCDGAGSQVRRSLFGSEFPGFTWEKQIVATNTYYDFDRFGWGDVSMIVHPEDYFMAARIDANGLWRITYGEETGLTAEELRRRQPAKWERILPGRPKPGDYKIVNFSPYKMHQRCAPSFRVGRVLLAADAAHLCNPWGGLGITGGFVDVAGLADCLGGIWDGLADDAILDLYSEKRIEKWRAFVDPVSRANFRRVAYTERPDELAESDEFVRMLLRAETDADFAKEVALGAMQIRYDFTQHYRADVPT